MHILASLVQIGPDWFWRRSQKYVMIMNRQMDARQQVIRTEVIKNVAQVS